jgi:hypothetical protein
VRAEKPPATERGTPNAPLGYDSANDATELRMPPERRKIPNMITHLWRGWTTVDNADAYERFLLGELSPSMREIPGFRGADILRRLSTTRSPS